MNTNPVQGAGIVPGQFLVFEGIDGSGKSTQAESAYNYLLSKGIPVVKTREMGGCPLSEKIRTLVISEFMNPITEILLASAARAEHLSQVIRPAIAKGHWVICDRFIGSTYAYQCGGQGVPKLYFNMMETMSLEGFYPDTVFFIDIPIEVSYQRLGQRSRDRFERDPEFLKRVYEAYQDLYIKNTSTLLDISQVVQVVGNKNQFEVSSFINYLLDKKIETFRKEQDAVARGDQNG